MSTKNNFVDIDGNLIEDNLCVETDSHGLMCPEDKVKLDGIETGANKTIVDTELSSTSTNPVQNKIINTALDGKLDIEAIATLTDEEIESICTFDGDGDNNAIPIATSSSIGCVSVGDGLNVTTEGALSVTPISNTEIETICDFNEGMSDDNIIPKATRTALGCIIVGNGLNIDSRGRLSATGGGSGVSTSGIGSSGMQLLWENSTPTTEFAAQTISVDYSDYDYICIVSKYSTTDVNEILYTYGEPGKSGTIRLFASGEYGNVGYNSRGFNITNNTIVFQNNYNHQMASTSSNGTNNTYNIPYQVYGLTISAPGIDYTLTEEKTINELLWTNPDETAEFAAQTINLDLTEYDAVLIYSRINKGTSASGTSSTDGASKYATYLTIGTGTYVNLAYNLWNGSVTPGFATRNVWVSTTGVGFASGYWHGSDSSGAQSNNFVIPVEIYGIRNKINVTTPVVTDKGMHTDLLWENASPTASFAAQTISLDLSQYNLVIISHSGDTSNNIAYSTISEIGTSTAFQFHSQVYSNSSTEPPYIFSRTFSVNSNGINFDTCYLRLSGNSTYRTTQNGYGIPTKIYGVKINSSTTSTIMADYIIEESTSGIWTYKKWNSGKFEAYGSETKSIAYSGTAWNMGYAGSQQTITVPKAISLNHASVSLYTVNGAFALNVRVAATGSNFTYVPINDLAVTASTDILYHVIGKWK